MIDIATTTDEHLIRRAHRELLAPSFRPAEVTSEDGLVTQVRDGAEVLLAREGDELRGLAVAEHFEAATLLAYLAVSPTARGGGVGNALVRDVLTRWGRDPSRLVLAEFDRPDVHPVHPLHGDPARRLRFYARHGAFALDLPYFQQPLGAEGRREHGLLLAVFDHDGTFAGRAESRLTPTQSEAVRGYLEAVLGGDDDAVANRLRAAAEAAGGVRVLPLESYPLIARSDVDPKNV